MMITMFIKLVVMRCFSFLKALLGTSYLNSLALGTVVVLLYSVAGGFFSVALTDGLQFFLLVAGILGGGLTAATHATKSGTRALVNTSPEPFSNWGVSLAEDVAVFGGLWTALNHPTLFVVLMVIFILLLLWLLPKLWWGIKKVFATLKGWISGKPQLGDEQQTNEAISQTQQKQSEEHENGETYRHVEAENKG